MKAFLSAGCSPFSPPLISQPGEPDFVPTRRSLRSHTGAWRKHGAQGDKVSDAPTALSQPADVRFGAA